MGKKSKQSNRDAEIARKKDRLGRLTDVVGELLGTRNQCVEGAALFTAAAERLGCKVDARAVSIFSKDAEGHAAATGTAASQWAIDNGVPGAPDPSKLVTDPSEFDRAGHMVLASSELSMIFDPSFRQFSASGLPDVVMASPVRSVRPESGTLDVGVRGLAVTYFFDDSNSGWQEGYEAARVAWSTAVDDIVRHVLNGGDGRNLGFAIDWDIIL